MAVEPTLKRSLTLPMITLYGLGTTVGAGIYVLVGKVAGMAGLYAPIAFFIASLMAAFTAFSFAELAGRLPSSAGEAVYVHAGTGLRSLATLVGLLVITAGTVSSGAIVHGFVGYFHEFIAAPDWLIIVAVVLVLGAIAGWGITESVLVACLITRVEIGGLLAIIGGGFDRFPEVVARLPEFLPPIEAHAWLGILFGAVLAFYAFIGFEDMVNVAEEVKNVRRNLPLAILITLGITTLLYILVSVLAIMALPVAELAASDAPLARLFEATTGASSAPISFIAIVAVLNGALIQIIMAARVLYGLSARGWLPARLGRVHGFTRTPLFATVLVTALWLPLTTLAETTSVVTLTIFALVNFSLLRIKRKGPAPASIRTVPAWVPLLGFLVSAGFVLFRLTGGFGAGGLFLRSSGDTHAPFGMQPFDRVLIEPDFLEHRAAVRAQGRRLHGAVLVRERFRTHHMGKRQAAHAGLCPPSKQPTCGHLRIGEEGLKIVHRRMEHVGRRQRRGPFGGRLLNKARFEQWQQLGLVRQAAIGA